MNNIRKILAAALVLVPLHCAVSEPMGKPTQDHSDKMMMEDSSKAMMQKDGGMMAVQENSIKPYSKELLDTAMKNGQSIAIQFHADWCPTCRSQAAALKKEVSEERFKDVVFLQADFDSDEALKDTLGVTKQSTLVVFKGAKEVGRSTGDTSPESLAKLISKSL